jgi:hypothetical protein
MTPLAITASCCDPLPCDAASNHLLEYVRNCRALPRRWRPRLRWRRPPAAAWTVPLTPAPYAMQSMTAATVHPPLLHPPSPASSKKCGGCARLPIPAGILLIPVFSAPVALFSQESRFLFRRNFFGTSSGKSVCMGPM